MRWLSRDRFGSGCQPKGHIIAVGVQILGRMREPAKSSTGLEGIALVRQRIQDDGSLFLQVGIPGDKRIVIKMKVWVADLAGRAILAQVRSQDRFKLKPVELSLHCFQDDFAVEFALHSCGPIVMRGSICWKMD